MSLFRSSVFILLFGCFDLVLSLNKLVDGMFYINNSACLLISHYSTY